MLVTPSPITTLVNALQSKNARSFMANTQSGMFMLFKAIQYAKAKAFITVVPSPISTSAKESQE